MFGKLPALGFELEVVEVKGQLRGAIQLETRLRSCIHCHPLNARKFYNFHDAKNIAIKNGHGGHGAHVVVRTMCF